MNNKLSGGAVRRCNFFADMGAELIIGDHVGISGTTINSCKKVVIGNHVVIGTGVCIFDTDFHSLDPRVRAGNADSIKKGAKRVIIEDHAFIGAYSIILKGVTIGKNSVVGAGSVVRASIPPNQIWAGNPAKFIIEIF
ncbi:MAG: acyltransferase [Leptospirales bacterium]|nr:acyltransferase [Leptospirales bacterium]